MELSLSAHTAEGHLVLEVTGEIDVYTAPQLRERLTALIEDGARRVVVDLDRVEFLDSTGLGVLVGALKRLRGVDGELVLVCDQERLLKIFRITGLDRVFTLYPSVPEATAARPAGTDPTGQEGTAARPAGTDPTGEADAAGDGSGSGRRGASEGGADGAGAAG